MTTFNKEELHKIAQLSALKIDESEVDAFVSQMGTILEFVDQLKQVTITAQAQQVCNVNVMREDKAIQRPSDDLLALAPERDGQYFIVPNILEEK
ncbi:MAG: Asp-tRNA(Asn)/Glu-tRNA(Gln) amidotransferase subunit GatC [Candidatus Babeliales bacterium]